MAFNINEAIYLDTNVIAELFLRNINKNPNHIKAKQIIGDAFRNKCRIYTSLFAMEEIFIVVQKTLQAESQSHKCAFKINNFLNEHNCILNFNLKNIGKYKFDNPKLINKIDEVVKLTQTDLKPIYSEDISSNSAQTISKAFSMITKNKKIDPCDAFQLALAHTTGMESFITNDKWLYRAANKTGLNAIWVSKYIQNK